jgi:hypothetical protein
MSDKLVSPPIAEMSEVVSATTFTGRLSKERGRSSRFSPPLIESSVDKETWINSLRIPKSLPPETVTYIKQALSDDYLWMHHEKRDSALRSRLKTWQAFIDTAFQPAGQDVANYRAERDAIAQMAMGINHPKLRLAMNSAIGKKLTERRNRITRAKLTDDTFGSNYIEQLRYINHGLITKMVLKYADLSPESDIADLEHTAERAFNTSMETWDPEVSKLSTYVMMPLRSSLQNLTMRDHKHGKKVGSYNAWDKDDWNAIDGLQQAGDHVEDKRADPSSDPVIMMGMKRAMKLAHIPTEEMAVVYSSLRHPDASTLELARAHGITPEKTRIILRKIPAKLVEVFPEFFEALKHHSEKPVTEPDLPKLLPRIRFKAGEKPRSLKQLANAIMEKSGDQLSAVCNEMGLYESSIRAMALGEWLPDAENIKTICAYTQLPVEIEAHLNLETRQRLISIRNKSPKNAHFKEVMGCATTHSSMREIADALTDGTVLEIGNLFSDKGEDRSQLYQALVKLVRRHNVQSIKEEHVKGLSRCLQAGSEETQILCDINACLLPRLPFTELLESHMDRGNPNLPQFFTEVGVNWNVSLGEIMRQLGVNGTNYSKYNRDHITKRQLIERWTDRMELTGMDAVRFYQLCRGNHALEAADDLINEARLQLRKSRHDPSIKPEELVWKTLMQVVHSTGILQDDLSATIRNIMAHNNKAIEARKASYNLDRPFAELLPDDPIAARRMANLTLGIYEERSGAQLLDSARRGEIQAYEIILQDRMFKRLKIEDYAKSVPYTDPKTGKKGLSHPFISAIENGASGIKDRAIADAMAETVGLTSKEDKADFSDMLLGIYKGPGPASTDSFASRALKGGRGYPKHQPAAGSARH